MAQSSDRVVIGKCVKAFSPNDGGYIHDETFEEVRCRVEDSDERLETRKDTPSSPSDGLTRFVSFSRSWLKTKEKSGLTSGGLSSLIAWILGQSSFKDVFVFCEVF